MNMMIPPAGRSHQARLITRGSLYDLAIYEPPNYTRILIEILIISRLIFITMFSFLFRQEQEWPVGFGVCCAWFYISGSPILKSVSNRCDQLLIFFFYYCREHPLIPCNLNCFAQMSENQVFYSQSRLMLNLPVQRESKILNELKNICEMRRIPKKICDLKIHVESNVGPKS